MSALFRPSKEGRRILVSLPGQDQSEAKRKERAEDPSCLIKVNLPHHKLFTRTRSLSSKVCYVKCCAKIEKE